MFQENYANLTNRISEITWVFIFQLLCDSFCWLGQDAGARDGELVTADLEGET